MGKEAAAAPKKADWKFLLIIGSITAFTALLTIFFVLREHYFPSLYRKLVMKEARVQELDPFLVAALIVHESGFGPEKVSNKGAIGLMQLCPSTAQELARLRLIEPNSFNLSSLTEPKTNVHLGTLYMRFLKKRATSTSERLEKIQKWYNGDPTPLVLHCYHSGPSIVLQEFFDHAQDLATYEEQIRTKKPLAWKYAHDVARTRERLHWFDSLVVYE